MNNANLLNLEIQVARARDFERMTVSSKVFSVESQLYALVCLSFFLVFLFFFNVSFRVYKTQKRFIS